MRARSIAEPSGPLSSIVYSFSAGRSKNRLTRPLGQVTSSLGDIAPYAYNIMGFNPDPAKLMEETAPELARRYRADGVDLLFMTCG